MKKDKSAVWNRQKWNGFFFLTALMVTTLMLLPNDVFARAGGGGGGGKGGWIAIVLYPFFIIYSWIMTTKVREKEKQCQNLLQKIAQKILFGIWTA